MKRFILAVLLLAPALLCAAQVMQPLSWKVTAEQTGSGTYDIHARGSFSADGWHIYAIGEEGGPTATVFTVAGTSFLVILSHKECPFSALVIVTPRRSNNAIYIFFIENK